MHERLLDVGCLRAADSGITNLRAEAWAIALDQRAFGPRRLVVAFADIDGTVRCITHTARSDPPEHALEACIRAYGLGSDVALAYCDEMITFGPPPDDLAERYERARDTAARYGVRLVDWISCDDELFRSSQLAVFPGDPWWDAPEVFRPDAGDV